MIYPVLNSDDDIFSKLARAVDEKEATGNDLAGVGVIATNDEKSTKEAIKNLLKTSNLNGIVIAKVPGGLGKFGTSQKDTLAKVKPEDIIKYVSVTTAPKFQEEVKPAKSKKSQGDTKAE